MKSLSILAGMVVLGLFFESLLTKYLLVDVNESETINNKARALDVSKGTNGAGNVLKQTVRL